MTLIFTNPLFTMIFAAVFLGHRLTLIKSFAGKELTIKIWQKFLQLSDGNDLESLQRGDSTLRSLLSELACLIET